MGRRGHGEGTTYKRADGQWVAVLELGYEGGKRKRKYVYAPSQREVLQKLDLAKRKQREGANIQVDERQTVSAFLAYWLENCIKQTVRPRTYDSYCSMVRLHIAPSFEKVRLQKLSAQDINTLLNNKRAAGLSASTVKYIHSILHRALAQAQKWDIVPRNVASLVTPPRITRDEVQPLDPEQARRLLEVIRGHRLEALYSVTLAVGLRQGEALGLKWEDVDLEGKVIHVRFQLQRIDKEYRLTEPKTQRSRRTIPLPPFAIAALHAHRARQLEEKLIAGSDWVDSGLVFVTLRGTPLDAKNVTHRFQDLLKKAGLPRMRFHDLRHACASLLLAQGVSPRVIMETLGHSEIGTTMNIYGHVLPSLQREAADKIGAVLGGD